MNHEPVWTRATPPEPGWYWVKRGDQEPSVTKVIPGDEVEAPSGFAAPDDDLLWAGPLSPPAGLPEAGASGPLPSEEERRKTLQTRAPSRTRLGALIAQTPAHDPWLDDEHDWPN